MKKREAVVKVLKDLHGRGYNIHSLTPDELIKKTEEDYGVTPSYPVVIASFETIKEFLIAGSGRQ